MAQSGRGRKTLKEELQVVQYMAELQPKVFKIISKALDSNLKLDQKWAVEQMTKLYAKAVPQKIGGDPDNRTPIPISNVFVNNGEKVEVPVISHSQNAIFSDDRNS